MTAKEAAEKIRFHLQSYHKIKWHDRSDGVIALIIQQAINDSQQCADFSEIAKSHPALNNRAFLDEWDEWVKYRKESKKKITKSTAAKMLAKLAKAGQDAAAMIDQSIENGWQGLFELNSGKGKSKGSLGKAFHDDNWKEGTDVSEL